MTGIFYSVVWALINYGIIKQKTKVGNGTHGTFTAKKNMQIQ